MNTLEIPLPFIMSDWTPEVRELLRLVVVAHQQSAVNNKNISSFAVVNTMEGSGHFPHSVVSGFLSIGCKHAPLIVTRQIIKRTKEHLPYADSWPKGYRMQGFGNSFFKDGDPAWEEVRAYVRGHFPETQTALDRLTQAAQKIKPHLLPNAAMWTAIACIEAGIPEGYESLLFLLARVPAWALLCMKPEVTT